MRIWFAVCLLLAAPVHAGLLDEFGGASEADIARDFEIGLPQFLAARMAEPVRPRIRATEAKRELYLELVEVKEDKTNWQELAPTGWYPQSTDYKYERFGAVHAFTTLQLPPEQIASWYIPQYRLQSEVLRLAVWLAARGQLMVANAKLAVLAEKKPALRPDIESWLCARQGWTRPEDGLRLVPTHHLEWRQDGALLLTAELEAERLKSLEKPAKEAFSRLEELQGNDLKSKPGQRKSSPKMRLDMLLDRAQRYRKAYAGTKFLDNKRNQDKLDKLIEAIKADMAVIEKERYEADRLGIEKNWKGCAAAWEALLRIDPENPEWIQKTAEARARAAVPRDKGKAEFPDEARRAAELYEKIIVIYPRTFAYHNHAGMNWVSAGDTARAKEHFQEVVRRTDGRADLDEHEQKNREFAEARLAELK